MKMYEVAAELHPRVNILRFCSGRADDARCLKFPEKIKKDSASIFIKLEKECRFAFGI